MAEQAARADQRERVLTEGFIWALASLCRLHRIPFDADLVLKQFPPAGYPLSRRYVVSLTVSQSPSAVPPSS